MIQRKPRHTRTNRPPSNAIDEVQWHVLGAEAVFQDLETSQNGLTQTQVQQRQERYGKNSLPARKPPSPLVIFLHQFLSPLIYILLFAGILSLLIGDRTDALFIFGVITFNGLLGTFQEWKAERSALALQNLLRIPVHVKREGLERQLFAEELVPGDIVFLESGARVPADIRLIYVTNLAVDESLLTGESIAVEKSKDALSQAYTPVNERSNMAFAGTTVTAGRGVGVVVGTGLSTAIGEIAESVTETEMAKTPLVLRMEAFSKQISYAFLGACGLLAVIAIFRGIPATEVFFVAIALAVSAIPEGLPVAMTVALSIGAQRMARRNVIVRKLTAVEGLGSCTCVATDKTGTLTVNSQTVKLISVGCRKRFVVTGEGYNGEGEIYPYEREEETPRSKDLLEHLAVSGILCNEANLFLDGGTWHSQGDPVDIALLAFGYKTGLSPEDVRNQVTFVGSIPYESERRFAAEVYRKGEETYVAIKGAVEVILPRCQRIQSEDGVVELESVAVDEEAESLAEDGYRVIAMAEGRIDTTKVDPATFSEANLPPLTFLGFFGLIDPVRPEVPEAIRVCKEAGVKVVMVTGDHPATALAIARELKIGCHWEEVTSGPELQEAGEPGSPGFQACVNRTTVFARVTPVQKLHIVEALRQSGHFVAVTGDGVNDAPALRTANIGVAMGSGTDVAKDTASIIITDDNFASIVAGVEEGRFAYDNVRKVIYLVLSTGAAEVILVALSLVFNLPLPLVAVQLLWLNLVTNGIQDVALAFEAGEPGALTRPPRKPGEGIFDALMIQQNLVAGLTMGIVAFGAWFYLLRSGWDEFSARNLTLLLMVLLENFHVFNSRSELVSVFRVPLRNNILLVAGVVVAQGLHILAMHLPGLQRVLQVAPVSPREWAGMLLLASVILVVMEIFKAIKRRQIGLTVLQSD